MTRQVSRRQFIANTGTLAMGVGASATTNVIAKELSQVEFKYGVASGDPLADAVIIWTHAKTAQSNQTVKLRWEVAIDEAFQNISQSGWVECSAKSGFTAKVDAQGLKPNQSYFYRFVHA